MKLAVFGWKGFTDYTKFQEELLKLPDFDEVTCIISGGPFGLGALTSRFAKDYDIPLIEFEPDYVEYGRSAPVVSYTDMIKYCDKAIVFLSPFSRGIIDIIYKLKWHNKEFIVVTV